MKEKLQAIFNAAIKTVNPYSAVIKAIKLEGSILKTDNREYNLDNGRVFVIGAGKGAAPMVQAAENLLGDRIEKGVAVVKYGHALKSGKIKIMEASHPVPDAAGEEGAYACLKTAEECEPDDLLISLFSGGASALLPLPAYGITLREIKETTAILLASGAEIGEINAIRKHLSGISGGRIAKAAKGQVLCLIVSDVIGDDLSVIASGPAFADISTFNDCLNIIKKYRLEYKLPSKIIKIIESGINGEIPETPKPDDPAFERTQHKIIASNGQALESACKKAQELCFITRMLPDCFVGDARLISMELINMAKNIQKSLKFNDKPVCLIAGGETTIKLTGSGLGGRNQEMALQAALELENCNGIYALFAGTDGTDGPTDAAGGFATGISCTNIGGREQICEYQNNNDSYNALKKSGDLFITGPTLTNVMDMAIILIEPLKKN